MDSISQISYADKFAYDSLVQLRLGSVAFVSETKCYPERSYSLTRSPSMTCALDSKDLADNPWQECWGDSGGPLVAHEGECDDVPFGDHSSDVQVDTVSLGLGCAWPNYPGIYADIANLYDCLEEALRRLECLLALPEDCGECLLLSADGNCCPLRPSHALPLCHLHDARHCGSVALAANSHGLSCSGTLS